MTEGAWRRCAAWAVFVAAGTAVCGPVLAQGTQASLLPALVAQDAELNATFRVALERAGAEARSDLQANQRNWVKSRNELCALSSRDAAASNWPANLAPDKADCVLRVTQNRVNSLRQYRPQATADTRPPASTNAFADTAQLLPIPEYTFPVGHTAGKFYAEFEIQKELLARTGGDKLYVGLDQGDGFNAFNGDAKLLPEDTHEVIGLAIDLEAHRFWWRNSRYTQDAQGQVLDQGNRPYTLKIRGGTDLHLLISRGWVRINHGQKPFKYPLPTGYAAWYTPGSDDDPSNWLAPPYERVAGRDRQQLANAYWTWLMDRDPAQNPTLDRTGALCGLKQGDRYWFLAGAALADRIERRCTVPYGTQLVLPAIAIMMDFQNMEDCRDNAKIASLAPHTFQAGWVEIDGRRFDRLQDYSANVSTCPPLDVGGKRVAAQANWLGLWVPLRPLPRGEHVISFGGRFNAGNRDRQVSYRVLVQ